ncbi:hypothetical protein ACRDNQ_13250 [Palleronia sp. KMU-117]|uniref:hypothetical protein n=1 Tax=Palleronia sp. KMU-117 TaxID=3434108 RepID=UPI003D74FE81
MMKSLPPFLLAVALAVALAACTSTSPFEPRIDTSSMPPDLPRSAIADLDPEVQKRIERGLTTIQRRLAPVCPPQDIRLMQEALVLFGWATTAEVPSPSMQAYVDRRAPELRAARDRLAPACRAQVDALVTEIRGTAR